MFHLREYQVPMFKKAISQCSICSRLTCFMHLLLCSAQICEMSEVFCVPMAGFVQHRQTHSVLK